MKVLDKIANEGCFAKKNYTFGLTLRDVQTWYLENVIKTYWTQLKTKALIQLGLGGRGKTPVSEIIALAVADHWKAVRGDELPPACYRITSDIDFLRGALGATISLLHRGCRLRWCSHCMCLCL